MSVEDIIVENEARRKRLDADFDPISGAGAPLERVELILKDHPIETQYVPARMMESGMVAALQRYGSIEKFIRQDMGCPYSPEMYEQVVRDLAIVRNRYDFPYWAYDSVKILNKQGGGLVPFKITYPQMRLLEILMDMLYNGVPIRIVLCKARQWGGSTLIQIFMGWIQLCLMKGWHSTIVAQVKNTAGTILEMYEKMIDNYEPWKLDLPEDTSIKLGSYGKSTPNSYAVKDKWGNNINDIAIQIGSVEEPDNIRGGAVALVHYSEVGVWKDTPGKKAADIIRSISGGLLLAPMTMEVLESTPKGTGNFFHIEYTRAKDGKSSRIAIFIPWYMIPYDRYPIEDMHAFAEWLISCKGNSEPVDGYLEEGTFYWMLWEKGATLEGINWYLMSRKGYDSHADWASEAPSDDIEAFQYSGRPVFNPIHVETLRSGCKKPKYIGEVISETGATSGQDCMKDLKLDIHPKGKLSIWAKPETDVKYANRYLVIVDIGGRWKKADWSVITVIDRLMMSMGGKPEIVAEWHGHVDHDILAWKAAQIAKFYCDALLVVESNTLEKEKEHETDGNDSEYILNLVSEVYSNLYARRASEEDIKKGIFSRWGFHTNSSTKPKIIHHMITCVREKAYIERSEGACYELSFYMKTDDGKFEAVKGQNDDRVMTRAIGLWICFREMDMPKEIVVGEIKQRKNLGLESTI